MVFDMIPRSTGYISVGSRRYTEWQTLAIEYTMKREEETVEKYAGMLVGHPIYQWPTRNLPCLATEEEEETEISEKGISRPGQEMTNGSKSQDQTTDGSHLTRNDQ